MLLSQQDHLGRQFVCIDSAVKKIFKLTSYDNTAFIRMCLGLSDVGAVIKKRFLHCISKHYAVTGAVILFFSLLCVFYLVLISIQYGCYYYYW